MSAPEKVYLGDSVYAEVEHGMIKLTTNNGMGDTNTIFTEESVFENLIEYGKRVFPSLKE